MVFLKSHYKGLTVGTAAFGSAVGYWLPTFLNVIKRG